MAGAKVDALKRVPLFATLDEGDLEWIAEATTEVETPADQVLIQPGQAGTGMFFITEGTAVVERKRTPVELGPGEFFGELALISPDARRTARVRAKETLRCLALDRASFRKLVSEHPDVAVSLLEVALTRLAENAGVSSD
ncbi:MAG: cyclic nucleotide-binding domain-containing protein [Gaiellaceae bacterium]